MCVLYPSPYAQVLVYNLRSPKTPTKAVIAHNTSVTSMVFKHKVDRQQVAQVMSVVKTTKLSQHKSNPLPQNCAGGDQGEHRASN